MAFSYYDMIQKHSTADVEHNRTKVHLFLAKEKELVQNMQHKTLPSIPQDITPSFEIDKSVSIRIGIDMGLHRLKSFGKRFFCKLDLIICELIIAFAFIHNGMFVRGSPIS